MNKLKQNEQKTNSYLTRMLLCTQGKLLHCCLRDSRRCSSTRWPAVVALIQLVLEWCGSSPSADQEARGVHAASEIPFSALNPLLCCCSAIAVSIYIPQSHFSGLKCVSVILCPTLIFWKNMKKQKWPLKATPENTEWPVTSQNSIWHCLPSYSSFTRFMVMLSHSEQLVWYFVCWTSCKHTCTC